MSLPNPLNTVGAETVILPPAVIPEGTIEPSPSDGGGYGFGSVLALDIDTLIIGAPFQGAAYIFFWDGTAWVQQAKLTAPDAAAQDEFGESVAVSGDTAVIGAHYKDWGGNSNIGAAYVFVRTGTSWNYQATLLLPDEVNRDYNRFGDTVAIDKDTVAVAALGNGNNAVYIYTRSGNTWVYQTSLTPTGYLSYYGTSLILRDTTLVVGAPETPGTWSHVYVYEGSGATWTRQKDLQPPNSTVNNCQNFDRFGISLALSDTTLAVGASSTDCTIDNTLIDGHGAVILYHRSDFTRETVLTSHDNTLRGVGSALALEDNLLLTSGATSTSNRGVLFSHEPEGWSRSRVYQPLNVESIFAFGQALGIHNGTLLTSGYVRETGRGEIRKVYTFSLANTVDIAVTQTLNPALVFMPNGDVSFTVTVTNNNSFPVPGVALAVQISPELRYKYAYKPAGSQCWAPSAQTNYMFLCDIGNMLPGAILTYTIVTITNQLGQFYSVAAVAPDALDSNPANDSSTIQSVVYPASTPGAPVQRNYISGDDVTLTWNRVPGATGYELQIDLSPSFPNPFTVTKEADALAATLTLTPPGYIYYWRVRALKTSGTSSWSAVDSFQMGG
ncbi:MAG TPA: hypothetical protein VHO69_10165 [Phototrophicaceae bacterium]|nr:hypothetical protein [Phototrophicaceae bacterium]